MLLDPDKVLYSVFFDLSEDSSYVFLYLAWLHYVYERSGCTRNFFQSFSRPPFSSIFRLERGCKSNAFFIPCNFFEK
jgi:hypothetical protein